MTFLKVTNLPTTRKGAIQFYKDKLRLAATSSTDEKENELAVWLTERWLCRNDLFYLLTVAMNRRDINRDWIFDRCREVQANPNGVLNLWAREHYKSTVITFGMSVLDILASHGDNPEPRYNGREITVGIFSHTRSIAKDFLKQIKREFETNDKLKALFPDILYGNPKKESPKWSEDEGIVVKRKTNPREATVEASGLVDGQPTGKHFMLRLYDDVVTRESVYTTEQILKTTAAWELSNNLGAVGGFERYAGTRYALHDTYSTIIERGIPAVVHACTSDGSEDWSKSVLMPPELLAEKRRIQGRYTFHAQMMQNPSGDLSQGFDVNWIRYWEARHWDNLNVYITVDPASKKKKDSDWTVMWVIGIDAAGNWMVIDMTYDRLNLTKRREALFDLHKRYKPIGVAYEEYGMQADIEHMIDYQNRVNYRFDITPVGGPMPKEDRIKRLVPYFEAGRIYLPRNGLVKINYEGIAVDVIQNFIDTQYKAFPVTVWDDALDSMARMLDMTLIYPELEPGDDKPAWKLEMEAELAELDGRTFQSS